METDILQCGLIAKQFGQALTSFFIFILPLRETNFHPQHTEERTAWHCIFDEESYFKVKWSLVLLNGRTLIGLFCDIFPGKYGKMFSYLSPSISFSSAIFVFERGIVDFSASSNTGL